MVRVIKTVFILVSLSLWFTFPLWIGIPVAYYLRHTFLAHVSWEDFSGGMAFGFIGLFIVLIWISAFGWTKFFTPLGEYLVKSARILTSDPPPPPQPQLPPPGALWETDNDGKVLRMKKKETGNV